MGIYLICFGDSEKNLEIALKANVIGITQNAFFDEKASAYMVIKRQDQWVVVARASVGRETNLNPFAMPNKFRTFEISNVELCDPFSISDILRSELGAMYGLVLRSPKLITAPGLVSEVADRFHIL